MPLVLSPCSFAKKEEYLTFLYLSQNCSYTKLVSCYLNKTILEKKYEEKTRNSMKQNKLVQLVS